MFTLGPQSRTNSPSRWRCGSRCWWNRGL